MIAHSFTGDIFGPAQELHGATYVVDAEFRGLELDTNGVIVDIGCAGKVLKSILEDLNYKNLDENKDFSDKNTTTEFLAYTVFQRLLTCIQQGDLGPSASSLDSMRITLHESHVAWAAYEGKINGDI
tara:strand:- start:87 stop:467 length:381 start_codon:yes stop_codon:yes gene_type:complete